MNQLSIRGVARGAAGLIIVAVLAAACSSAATSAPTQAPSQAPVASSAPSTAAGSPAAGSPAAAGTVVNMATTSLGPVLTGPNGLTLYTHAGDSTTASTCTGGCAAAWPPLVGPATGGTGVSGTFATLTRDDGSVQVTYNGLPLYGWKNDSKPGDVTGQGVNGFAVAKP